MARWRSHTLSRTLRAAGALVSVVWASGVVRPPPAEAQQVSSTFTLDRMMVPGGPDDGIAVYRPVTSDKTILFGQIGLGYSLNPLHTNNVTQESATLSASPAGLVQGQFTQYTTVGIEFLDRFTASVSLPIYWDQWGANPKYTGGGFDGVPDSAYANFGTAAGDTRIDARGIILRSRDRRAALGAEASLFVPTGTSTAFGGDGQTTGMIGLSGEYAFQLTHTLSLIAVANMSLDFRPVSTFNAPPGGQQGDGLAVGDEWRWAFAAFLPLKDNKYRLGLTIFGQTGIENTFLSGNTFFANQNNPLEWQAEGRMRFGAYDRFWAGVGAGSRLDQSYGAPDFRMIALIGYQFPIFDVNPPSPEDAKLHRKKTVGIIDSDHDGIPDDIDACPNEPEDHLGDDPNDGCPLPPDRDHDGIPDQFDKCPDEPEDHKGAAPNDGCPDIDSDKDGIPDSVDACPHEPGQPSPDPKKNGCPQFIRLEGSSVRVLQQVHFATGKADILPESFPILQEIANLLKVTPSIKRMSIEGHTDNRGAAAMNLHLSQARSESVMAWLVTRGGIESKRLEAHGYGMTRPIETNDTDEGRLANRRVEFKIKDENEPVGSQPAAKPTP